jgi:hypothetical protein
VHHRDEPTVQSSAPITTRDRSERGASCRRTSARRRHAIARPRTVSIALAPSFRRNRATKTSTVLDRGPPHAGRCALPARPARRRDRDGA